MSGRTVICDIQGFRGFRNEFIIKELAFLSASGGKAQTFIFKSPYQLTVLPEIQQKVASWVKRFVHGIDWNDGYIPYQDLKNVIDRVLRNYNTVLVKGLEKKMVIENIMSEKSINVLDMESMRCPKINDLKKDIGSFRKCFYHSKSTDQCANENVRVLLTWYLNVYLKNINVTEVEKRTIKKVGEVIDKFNKKDEYGIASISNLKISDMTYLPKEYFLHHVSPTDIQYVWDLLPVHMKNNLKDIIYCYEHYNQPGGDHIDGPPPRKENCGKCLQLK
jgi:hypothetical protein